jgi:hypothetical protein
MNINIRKAEQADCGQMMELIKELALYEKAPEEVTVKFDHFVESGFGPNPIWWAYVAEITNEDQSKNIVGFANWTDFYSNNDNSKLFFIKVDFETQNVNFYHKLSTDIQEKIVLRNAKETAKTIQTIKQVLTEDNWAKYLKYDDLDILRKEIINELVNSANSFLEIKKKYL